MDKRGSKGLFASGLLEPGQTGGSVGRSSGSCSYELDSNLHSSAYAHCNYCLCHKDNGHIGHLVQCVCWVSGVLVLLHYVLSLPATIICVQSSSHDITPSCFNKRSSRPLLL